MKILRYLMAVVALAFAKQPVSAVDTHKKVFDVATPKMKVFLPKDDLNTGRAVVACPGGSYLGHAIGHEGWDWAPFFNKQGIALIVLEYTLPAGDRTKPIADAEAAIKMVRDSAEVWHINPAEVGIMGSSAGGHLCFYNRYSQHSSRSTPRLPDSFLPRYLNGPCAWSPAHSRKFPRQNPSKELIDKYSNEKQVTPQTPRAIILTSDDDGVNPATNSAPYYIRTPPGRRARMSPRIS